MDEYPSLPRSLRFSPNNSTSKPPTEYAPKISTQPPQKSVWARGPPQISTPAPPTRSQSHLLPPQQNATNPFVQTHSRRSSALGQKGVTIRDGINIPCRDSIGTSKQNSVTFGSVDDDSATILKPLPSFGNPSFGKQAGPSSLKHSSSTSNPPPPTIISPTATKRVAPSLTKSESSTSERDVPAPSPTSINEAAPPTKCGCPQSAHTSDSPPSENTISTSTNSGESYPAYGSSISQLLCAIKRKLCNSTSGGRISTIMNQIEVDVLEQDTLEVLSLVRSMKNDFAPINRIPSDVFSLIPKYLEKSEMDENLIALTHVCHGWRELLIATPLLWTQLDCADTDKTRVYIERSKLSPLEISLSLFRRGEPTYLEDALLLVVPHISRTKSLSIGGSTNLLRNLTPHLSCPIPLLKTLSINLTCYPAPALEGALFNGDLSSLRTLSLTGVITHLPWENLSELTTFTLSHVPKDKISITQLLDFFLNAHRLRDITLCHAIPTSSNAPPERVVPLPRLKNLTIDADPAHSTLLNHLSIPVGALLTLEFDHIGNESPLPQFLPKSLGNLKNLPPITSVDLCLPQYEKHVRLGGPNGGLHMFGHWRDTQKTPSILESRVLRSLSCFVLSGTQRLAITEYEPLTVDKIDESAPYHILLHMDDLYTLTLNQCNNLPFIFALNPVQNPSKHTLCPKLREITIYVKDLKSFNITELMSMAKERASAGTKLSSITIVGLGELVPGENVFKLKEYVRRVYYRVEEKPPGWDGALGSGYD